MLFRRWPGNHAVQNFTPGRLGILPKTLWYSTKKNHLEISKENWTRQLGKGPLVFYQNHLRDLLWPTQVSYRALVCLLTVVHKSSCNSPDLSDYPDQGRLCNLHCHSSHNAVMEGQSPWNVCVIGGWQGNMWCNNRVFQLIKGTTSPNNKIIKQFSHRSNLLSDANEGKLCQSRWFLISSVLSGLKNANAKRRVF